MAGSPAALCRALPAEVVLADDGPGSARAELRKTSPLKPEPSCCPASSLFALSAESSSSRPAMASRSLFVSSGELIDGAAVASFVRARGAALEGLMLATHAGLAASKQQAFASICSVTSLEATHSEALCSLLFSLLQPGGSLLVQQTAQVCAALLRHLAAPQES